MVMIVLVVLYLYLTVAESARFAQHEQWRAPEANGANVSNADAGRATRTLRFGIYVKLTHTRN